jgi:hypothetical protein
VCLCYVRKRDKRYCEHVEMVEVTSYQADSRMSGPVHVIVWSGMPVRVCNGWYNGRGFLPQFHSLKGPTTGGKSRIGRQSMEL